MTLGVGGGILHDSIARDEFEEMQLKAKFLLGIARQ
jgi:anthranilate/para-aminobenzoate synthase component I